MEQLKETTGQLPEKLSADNGYMSGDNLAALETDSIDVYIATDKGEKTSKQALDETERKWVKADFDYDEVKDRFFCPGGQSLELKRQTNAGLKT